MSVIYFAKRSSLESYTVQSSECLVRLFWLSRSNLGLNTKITYTVLQDGICVLVVGGDLLLSGLILILFVPAGA